MSAQFRITIRFLDGEFHGRCDGGEPEWPPSPLRLFQALTNAAARLNGDGICEEYAAALRWFEAQANPPEIVASKTTETSGYQLYVPDNVGDLVAKQWAAGKDFDSKNHAIDISGYRTEKRVRPLRLADEAVVHYLWASDEELFAEHGDTLIIMARAVTHLGWGVDLVVVDASSGPAGIPITEASGERWLPVATQGGTRLRVPVAGTFEGLVARHAAFLGRLQPGRNGTHVFRPVPPLSDFRVVTYRRDTDLAEPPYAVFSLRRTDNSGFATFDPQWRRLHLTGMLRHAASQPDFARTLGWSMDKVNSFILGHDAGDASDPKPATELARLVFIPLPSIEWRGSEHGDTIGSIRRVLVTITGGDGLPELTEFPRILRALEGIDLVDEKTHEPVAFLRRQSDGDRAISSYLGESASWTTVTPVVLPGYDDPRKLRSRLNVSEEPISADVKEQIVRKLDKRIDRLLRKALCEAGMPDPLVANANLEWSGSGFYAGVDLSSRYSVPDQCRRFRRLHVRITWRELAPDGILCPKKVKGPLCVGSGRFAGLGLFVPCD